jgi:hypothetical protein
LNYIPTIIDYGFVHYKVKDTSYGMYGKEEFGVNPDMSFPLFDIYKFFMYSANTAERVKRSDIYKESEKIFKWFSCKNLLDVLDYQDSPNNKAYLQLPPTPELLNKSNADFGEFLLRNSVLMHRFGFF